MKRLQLGISRLETLDVRVLDKFLDKSWTHLGDAEPSPETSRLARVYDLFRARPLHFTRLLFRRFSGGGAEFRMSKADPRQLYEATNFEPFFFKKGDRLRFADGSFDYVFSEHFFHHLFLDDAVALFLECHRVLKPFGVLRTVVPDADLRSYEPPETVGFPDARLSFEAPSKHKTRYSVYMLAEVLSLCGFEPVPLRYCDRTGAYVRKNPAEMPEVYASCPERELVFRLDHILRLDSLVVDGIKLPT